MLLDGDNSRFASLFHKLIAHKNILIAILLYFSIASFLTYPFIISPASTLTAPNAGDVSSSVTKFDAIKREGANPLEDDRLYSVASPEGIASNVAVDRVSILSTLCLWLLTLLTSALVSNGLITFSGYFLTGFISYLFIRRITNHTYISLLGGTIYCIFPLIISLARAAPIYTHMWMYILPIWMFWNISLLDKVPRSKYIWGALSILPAMFWTPYFTFHILLVGGASLLAVLVIKLRQQATLQRLLPFLYIVFFWIFLCAIYIFLGISTAKGGAPQRTIDEAYEQSANILMYLLPGSTSLWGGDLYAKLIEIVPRAKDTNIYLGLSLITLAVIGGLQYVKKIPYGLKNIIIISLFVILITLIFSFAPVITILGIDIPTPNKLIVELVPALRAGQRLAAPMMGAIIILSCVAILVITKKKSTKYAGFALVSISLLVFIDISSRPQELTFSIPESSSIRALKLQPKGLTAQYVKSSIGDPGQIACQMQLIHEQPLINDCGIKPENNPHYVSPILRRVSSSATLCGQELQLKKEGVKYVILSKTEWDLLVQCYSNSMSYKLFLEDSYFSVYALK